MSDPAIDKLWARCAKEEYSKLLGLEVLDIQPGFAKVAMDFGPHLTNIFGMLHGGAVFSLLDEAFQLACNAYGTVAVAQEVNIYFLAPAQPGERLIAEMSEINATRKTALYKAEVFQESDNKVIASGQALAYRKGSPHPFDDQGNLTT